MIKCKMSENKENMQWPSARNLASLYGGGVAINHTSTIGGTRIPLPRQTSIMNTTATPAQDNKENSIVIGKFVERWKNRYEEAERKHKASIVKQDKVKRDYDELLRKHNILIDERNHLENELKDREKQLNRLKNASEKIYKEYQQLRNQHEVDTGVIQKVMEKAGEWYKQNKQLKRRSTVILQSLPTNNTIDIDFTDSIDTASDSSNEELEFLKQTVSDLTKEVAQLQTELSSVKLQEFEATELSVNLTQELECERELREKYEKELNELRNQIEQNNRVSKLLIDEVTALKKEAEEDREMAETFKSEAKQANKRVNILTHQSTLLMGDLQLDERLLNLMNEIENLKSALENQNIRHFEEIDELQAKLAEKNEESELILWEEKYKMAELELNKALERAEQAERKLSDVNKRQRLKKQNSVMSRVNYFENGSQSLDEEKIEASSKEIPLENSAPSEVCSPPPPPPAPVAPPPPPPPAPVAPPPPPPPPIPPPPAVAFIPTSNGSDSIAAKASQLSSKANDPSKDGKAGSGAIDAIVDQIKGGKFQLKSTGQNFLERKSKEDQPEAVKEMLTILGTLKKRKNTRKPSFISKSNVDSRINV